MSDLALARKYCVSDSANRSLRYRTDVYDCPHTQHNLLTTLTPHQEEVLIAVREFLHPALSLSALARMLKRRPVPTLAQMLKQKQENAQGSEHKYKLFKGYNPGFVHVDIKCLP